MRNAATDERDPRHDARILGEAERKARNERDPQEERHEAGADKPRPSRLRSNLERQADLRDAERYHHDSDEQRDGCRTLAPLSGLMTMKRAGDQFEVGEVVNPERRVGACTEEPR